MPFTPTHIAAVVPIAAVCRQLPFSGLAIGCMVPDLPVFCPFVDYAVLHSPLGVLTNCLPIGIGIFLVFQCLIKIPVVSLLPRWIQDRIGANGLPFVLPSFRFVMLVSISIVIGAYTHLIWDSFTHEGRWGTILVPVLNENVLLAGRLVPGYKLLQYGSTLIVLPLFIAVYANVLRKKKPTAVEGLFRFSARSKFIGLLLFVSIPCLVAILMLASNATIVEKVSKTITISGNRLALGVVVYSVIFHTATRGKFVT